MALVPFRRQEKWKPKRRCLARVSGIPLHCQVGSLLCSALGLASTAAHAGSLLQSVSSETNPGSASGDRQGALGLAPTHTMLFFGSAQSDSSKALLQRRDVTIGKLLPEEGETLPQPGAGTSCPDSELLLLTQKLF